ncbi:MULTISPECIES: hypothetical protein [unclassified Synechocystis]|uniref:hypothetical protein n=1 Tax=unclassified Synechocystis TaxID=2640012 RepID=UPI000427D0F6|nr:MULTISPECIES: hypothetical protein [unclassified Synechocystis]AIE74455.1 hypothetical protein D082_19270 [Synechocystis sp. PCC 6714]MCT0254780.1 hypothetical protein [Synechocystis sp. CS-94]
MSTQDKARELLAKERQQENQLNENMVARATETDLTVAEELDEKARELLAEERQQEKHMEETMLSRSTEELS